MSDDRDGEAATDAGGCQCKVGRSASRYGLDDIDDRLVDRWIGEGTDSLRELERFFNTAVVRGAVESAGETVLDGEAENYYRLLTDDETSDGNRIEARRDLQRRGVDVEALTDSFVSHQTVHTHLRSCLDASYDRTLDPEQRAENARAYVRSLQARTERITTETLTQLRDSGVHDLAAFSVHVDLLVTCEACGRVQPVADVFERGGCVCQASGEQP